MPLGLKCYKEAKKSLEKCIPCKGIYFKVERDKDFRVEERLEEISTFLDNYTEYKSGFINGTEGKQLTFDTFFLTILFLKNIKGKLSSIWSRFILTLQHFLSSQKMRRVILKTNYHLLVELWVYWQAFQLSVVSRLFTLESKLLLSSS